MTRSHGVWWRDSGPGLSNGQLLWKPPGMDERTCLICSHPNHLPDDVVADLGVAWVTAGTNAPLPGYACVVAKRHVVEPYEMPPCRDRVGAPRSAAGAPWRRKARTAT